MTRSFEAAAREVGFLGYGLYPRSGFIHVDLGPARQWGERFPPRAVAFAEKAPPAREVLAQRRPFRAAGQRASPRWVRRASKWRSTFWLRRRPPSCQWSRISIRSAGRSSPWRLGDCVLDLRASRRLEAGAAVIAAFLTGLPASLWMRTALYCGATTPEKRPSRNLPRRSCRTHGRRQTPADPQQCGLVCTRQ